MVMVAVDSRRFRYRRWMNVMAIFVRDSRRVVFGFCAGGGVVARL